MQTPLGILSARPKEAVLFKERAKAQKNAKNECFAWWCGLTFEKKHLEPQVKIKKSKQYDGTMILFTQEDPY